VLKKQRSPMNCIKNKNPLSTSFGATEQRSIARNETCYGALDVEHHTKFEKHILRACIGVYITN
jgi:hypothetical protein